MFMIRINSRSEGEGMPFSIEKRFFGITADGQNVYDYIVRVFRWDEKRRCFATGHGRAVP